MSRVWVGTKSEFSGNKLKIVQIGDKKIEIGIYYIDGEFYAWRNVCPHQGAPICQGNISGTRLSSDVYEYIYGCDQQILQCPWHGWEFNLKTGEHLVEGGSRAKLKGYRVEVDRDNIFVVM